MSLSEQLIEVNEEKLITNSKIPNKKLRVKAIISRLICLNFNYKY
jgi:hypothetical protein